jgi:hypothetical protein
VEFAVRVHGTTFKPGPESSGALTFCFGTVLALVWFIGPLCRSTSHMIVHALPFAIVQKVPGEIEGAPAGKLVSGQAHAVPAKRKRRRRPVFDGVPSVKPDVKNKRTLHLDEQVAIRGQCHEGSLGAPMPCSGIRRFVAPVLLDAVQQFDRALFLSRVEKF